MALLKHAPKVIALVIALWVGWQMYAYFLDNTVAVVAVNGINENCYYAGDVRCAVQSDKTGDISLWLDTQNLANNVRIKANHDGQLFTIPTKTLSNGKHLLKVEFADSSFHHNKAALSCEFHVDNLPLQAVFVKQALLIRCFKEEHCMFSFRLTKR